MLIDRAQSYLRHGHLDSAATYAQIAAQFAWMNHTGLFVSAELETILREISALCETAATYRRPKDEPDRVLHVMTQAYQTGGHTRAVRCWIAQDVGRHHQVCITRQGTKPPPNDLAAQLETPGDLVRLDVRRGLLLRRAAALRLLAANSDIVLLHTHPYDAVPLLAFGGAVTTGPPVIYVNHADHVFWLGVGAGNLVLNMRDSGERLATTRRGVDPGRSAVLSWPLMSGGRDVGREEAKRRLGLDPNRVLIVTAADGSKYRPLTRPSFVDLVLPVLERHESAVLLAAGPLPEGEWLQASDRTGGRIRALGRLADVTPLHLAADIYLDSFPFSSGTSLLEAGSFGTPTITYRGHPASCAVLGADSPSLAEHLLCPSDPEMLREVLGQAITDRRWRVELGERTQRAISDRHTGPGWRTAAADVYRLAAQAGGRHPLVPVERQTTELDLRVDAIMALTSFSEGLTGALRDQLTLLPVAPRSQGHDDPGPSGCAAACTASRPRVAAGPRWALARSRQGAACTAEGGSPPRLTPSGRAGGEREHAESPSPQISLRVRTGSASPILPGDQHELLAQFRLLELASRCARDRPR